MFSLLRSAQLRSTLKYERTLRYGALGTFQFFIKNASFVPNSDEIQAFTLKVLHFNERTSLHFTVE